MGLLAMSDCRKKRLDSWPRVVLVRFVRIDGAYEAWSLSGFFNERQLCHYAKWIVWARILPCLSIHRLLHLLIDWLIFWLIDFFDWLPWSTSWSRRNNRLGTEKEIVDFFWQAVVYISFRLTIYSFSLTAYESVLFHWFSIIYYFLSVFHYELRTPFSPLHGQHDSFNCSIHPSFPLGPWFPCDFLVSHLTDLLCYWLRLWFWFSLRFVSFGLSRLLSLEKLLREHFF